MRKQSVFSLVVIFLGVATFSFADEAPVQTNSITPPKVNAAISPQTNSANPPQIKETTSPQKKDQPQNPSITKDDQRFSWWPTDASPAPVKDAERGGYWWWPTKPGTVKDLWGNRGFVYLYKVIFDYKTVARSVDVRLDNIRGAALEPKPSLLVKRTVRKSILSFAGNSTELKGEHVAALKKAVRMLKNNATVDILITAPAAASDEATVLGETRVASVQKYLVEQGVKPDRIKVLGSGKLDDVFAAKKGQLPQQKEGTVQLVIAEVEELMIPAEH